MESLLNDSKTILTLIGAAAILILIVFITKIYLNKMKYSKAEGELSDHNWDGIREFKNDLPLGWALSFICVIIWGIWYFFIGYPLNSYSQIGEYNKEVVEYNDKYKAKWSSLSDSQLSDMGDSIFQVQCAQCHGIDKSGIDGRSANLNKWGRSEFIVDVILNGSEGMGYDAGIMPPIEISKEEAKDIANFVMADISSLKLQANADSVARGKDLFAANCASCHGDNGKGLEGMENFAPNLENYGTYLFLQEVLLRGKSGAKGKMPSFKYANFDEYQEKALNSFIMSNM